MDKFLDYDDVDPYSEADAKEEWDEWMKQSIMDDKAQQENAVRFEFDIEPCALRAIFSFSSAKKRRKTKIRGD